MNIYEKLNKINDAESLSEKYNVKNAKELKRLQESASWSEKTYKFKYIPIDPEYYTMSNVELDLSEEDIHKAYKTKKFPPVMWLDGEAYITRNNDDDYGSYYEVSWTDDISDYVECSSVAECKAVVSDYYDGNVRWANIKQTGNTDEINFHKFLKFLYEEQEKFKKLLKPKFKLIQKYLKDPYAYGNVSNITSKTLLDRATSAPEISINVPYNKEDLSEAKRVVDDVLSGIAVFKGYNTLYTCLVYDLTGDVLLKWNNVVEDYLNTHDVNLDYAKNEFVFNTGELVSID